MTSKMARNLIQKCHDSSYRYFWQAAMVSGLYKMLWANKRSLNFKKCRCWVKSITMQFKEKTSGFVVIGMLVVLIAEVQGHGMMMDPIGRASRWRNNGSAPKNYDDNALYCGGFNHQWAVNKGKCGLCGDDYSLRAPRPHEIGGLYGEGIIVKTYKVGNVIPVGIQITANHKGHFSFNLCNLDKSKETEDCYQKNKLKLSDGSDKYWLPSTNAGMYTLKLQLPMGITCMHCSLRWTYVAGNNWGLCPNNTGAIGCGPQEHFRSCADVRITSKTFQDSINLVDKDYLATYSGDDLIAIIKKQRSLEKDLNEASNQKILYLAKKVLSLILKPKHYEQIVNSVDSTSISED